MKSTRKYLQRPHSSKVRTSRSTASPAPVTAVPVEEQASEPVLLHSVRTAHQQIYVYQSGSTRLLSFETGATPVTQSWIDTADLLSLDHYQSAMVTATAFHAAPSRVLCLGVGGGAIPRAIRRLFPTATVDAVDIDEEVLWTAHSWFDLAADDALRLYADDARDFVRAAHAKGLRWDVVVTDVCDHQYVPAHLMTVEYLRELRNVMADDGLIVSNVFSQGRLRDLESRTYEEVFGSFLEFSSNRTNRAIVAHKTAAPQIDVIHANLRAHADDLTRIGIGPESASGLRLASGWPADTSPLIDDAQQCPDLASLRQQAAADAVAAVSP